MLCLQSPLINANVNRMFLYTSRSRRPIFSFQRSFYLVYFSALLGDWLQGPYVYKLYAYYGFKESQIAVLYVVSVPTLPA